ncbi:MAG: histidine phosphatase family protein [Gammaproteobacteria bacterium]|nr:histidine phosphatase family protein [Gammaproteobacteria bacterium]
MPSEYRQHRFVSPTGSTDILLVRHGESEAANPDCPFPLVDGQGDPPLHEVGHVQAHQVAERLQHEPIKAIYVSNLRRTAQTADPLARTLDLVPTVIPDLKEIHLGDYEGGLYRKKVAENDPKLRRAISEQRWDLIPGAEKNEDFEERLLSAISRISETHPDQLVAAFVHRAVIGQIVSSATGSKSMSFLGADNGSITHIVVTKSRILVRRFNDTSHLTKRYWSHADSSR